MNDKRNLIDSHCHLPKNRFTKVWEENLRQWKKIGLRYIVGVSMTWKETLKMIELAKTDEMILPAIGIHPWEIKKPIDPETFYDDFAKLIKAHPEIKIIGEVGLDYRFVQKKERYPYQRDAFDVFSKLAGDYDLILNIHCVNATADLLEILRTNNVSPNQCIFHWYSGTSEELQQVLDFGAYFSITPAVEYAERHQSTAKHAPLTRLLTESDGDVKYKTGIRGSPSVIPQILEKLSIIKNKEVTEIIEQILTNFSFLMGLE